MGRTGHYANRPSAEMTDITIERTYPTSPERVWELWTTPAGIEQWWAPDRFEAKVAKLELEPGGELDHSPTATAPEQTIYGSPPKTVGAPTERACAVRGTQESAV